MKSLKAMIESWSYGALVDELEIAGSNPTDVKIFGYWKYLLSIGKACKAIINSHGL